MPRAVVFNGVEDVSVQEFPRRDVGPRDVVLRIDMCGVCGSDVSTYYSGAYVRPGQVMGHEFVGTVTSAGSDSGLDVGTRAIVRPMRSCGACWYCRRGDIHLCSATGELSLSFGRPGGYAEEVHVPDCTPGVDVFRIPDDCPTRDALWAEPLAVALRAVSMAAPLAGLRVAVVGAGSLGLCLTAAAAASGAHVLVAEPRAVRREMALKSGASSGVADARDVGEVDLVLDSSGSAGAIADACRRITPGGSIVLVGVTSQVLPELPNVDAQGSFGYRAEDFARAVELIVSGAVSLGHAVSHVFDLDSFTEAMVTVKENHEAGKVVIVP
jgi:2-desacetyl-2-hydroxyethyl bacteriochlorophyllide A dehydrogenase